ncbi:MAG: M48 family metalloprotease [Anaerolineales bacterium]
MASAVSEPPIVLDESRQRSAREYARVRRRLWALQLVVSGVLFLGLIASGAALAWLEFLRERWALSPAAEIGAVAFALGGAAFLINLPLDYYSGFVLPHRYGLSVQSLSGWIEDTVKGSGISAGLGLLAVQVVYAFLGAAASAWWLWSGISLLAATVLLAAIQPIVLMPLFYKIRPLGEADQFTVERLTRLAAKAGVRVRGVFSFDMSRRTKAANAALAGLGRTRRILLGDTLLQNFSPDEVETVLAHELGHHVHRDIPLGILIQASFQFGAFYVAGVVMKGAVSWLGLRGIEDPAGMPVLALTLGALGLLVLPLANAYSRWRESMADEFALRLSQKPGAFASAMTRLANQNLADADPEPWVVWLLHSHPPLRERIARARAAAS